MERKLVKDVKVIAEGSESDSIKRKDDNEQRVQWKLMQQHKRSISQLNERVEMEVSSESDNVENQWTGLLRAADKVYSWTRDPAAIHEVTCWWNSEVYNAMQKCFK